MVHPGKGILWIMNIPSRITTSGNQLVGKWGDNISYLSWRNSRAFLFSDLWGIQFVSAIAQGSSKYWSWVGSWFNPFCANNRFRRQRETIFFCLSTFVSCCFVTFCLANVCSLHFFLFVFLALDRWSMQVMTNFKNSCWPMLRKSRRSPFALG